MNTLHIIGFSIIFAYIFYAMIKVRGIPTSISSSVYTFNTARKWVFTLVMWCVGFMIAPHLFVISSDSTRFLVFWMIAGMLGVGADPLDKDEKNTFHYASAIVCGISSQLLLFFNFPTALWLWALYVPYTLIWEFSGKNMFFAETIMIIGIALYSLLC